MSESEQLEDTNSNSNLVLSDGSLGAEIKVNHDKRLITMYGKELVKEHSDVYMKFLSSLVLRNQATGQNYDILLK